MKNFVRVLVLFGFCAAALCSCGSLPADNSTPAEKSAAVDRGVYNPDGRPESELAFLEIGRYLSVESVDKKPVSWKGINTSSWGPLSFFVQNVTLSAGLHTFAVSYRDERIMGTATLDVAAEMKPGATYFMRPNLDDHGTFTYLTIHIYDEQDKDISFAPRPVNNNANNAPSADIASMFGSNKNGTGGSASSGNAESAGSVYAAYFQNIYTPILNGYVVRLENERTILEMNTLFFEMTDKTTLEKTSGLARFNLDSATGTLYLGGDIDTLAKTGAMPAYDAAPLVLSPVRCDSKSVTYRCIRPESRKGGEVTFSIVSIKKMSGGK